MLRQLSNLVTAENHAVRRQYLILTGISIALKAAFILALVPLLRELFLAQWPAVWLWTAVFVGCWLLTLFLDSRTGHLAAELGFGLMDTVQRRLVAHLGELPLGWFQSESNNSQARQAVSTSGPELASLVMNVVTPLLNAILLPMLISLGLFLVHPILGATAVAAAILLWGALQLGGRLEKTAEKRFANANVTLNERVIEFARTQPVLRASRQTDPTLTAVGQAVSRNFNAIVHLLLAQIPAQLLFSFANQLALIGLSTTTIWLTIDGRLAPAECIALLVLIVRFLEPFGVLSELNVAITGSSRTLGHIHDILNNPTINEQSPANELPPFTAVPTIQFDHVTFTYPGATQKALDDVSLHIPAGQVTAVVGPSGSGKSTLFNLLVRFFDPQQGHISFDGHDIRHLPPRLLLQQISAIWQEVFLFDATIRENILLGAAEASKQSDSELEEVARLSGVSEIVARLPQGWETRVGEGGSALSGGEKQRVSIARALLKKAPILLVDEATSALDNQNQTLVATAVNSQAGQRTVLVIAHQLNTIQDADHIIFLENGRVVEQGDKESLLASNGRFATYWQQRQKSAHWQVK